MGKATIPQHRRNVVLPSHTEVVKLWQGASPKRMILEEPRQVAVSVVVVELTEEQWLRSPCARHQRVDHRRVERQIAVGVVIVKRSVLARVAAVHFGAS